MIIFLYGSDSFRSQRFLTEMKNRFLKEVTASESSFDTISGQELELNKIIEKINTGSLFAHKRMLVIKNIFTNKKTSIFSSLLKYLAKLEKQEDIILIFKDGGIDISKLKSDAKKLFTFLTKQKYSQEFRALSSTGLNNFIKKEVEKYNKKIKRDALEELLKRTDGDLWLIAQSLKKASLSTPAPVLQTEHLILYISEKFNENIFALTDALSAKNKEQATKILEEQYNAGISEEYLISMLARQFKILLELKEAKNQGLGVNEITSFLKLHPFVVKKGLTQINNFELEKLKLYFNKIISYDKQNKSGQGNLKSNLLLLIAEL